MAHLDEELLRSLNTKEVVEELFEEIRLSERMQFDWAADGRRNLEYLEGRIFTSFDHEAFRGKKPQIGRVPINIYLSFFKSIAPALYMHRPRALASPSDQAYWHAAEQMEAILNWNLEISGWDKQMMLTVNNALIYGIGWIRFGFGDPWGGMVSAKPGGGRMSQVREAFDNEMLAASGGQTIGEMGAELMDKARNGVHAKFRVNHPTMKRPRLQNNKFIRPGQVWGLACNSEDVFGAYDASGWDDTRYMFQRSYMSKRQFLELCKMKRWEGFNPEDVPSYSFRRDLPYIGSEQDQMRGRTWVDMESQKLPQQVKLYEFFSREMGTYFLLAHGLETQALEIREWPCPGGEFPWVGMQFSERTDLLYPPSDFTQLASHQDQLNVFNSIYTDTVARQKTVIATQKGMIEPSEEQAVKRAGPIAFLKFKQPIQGIFQPFDIKADVGELLRAIAILQVQARVIFGLPNEEQGAASEVDSATQSAILANRSELKHYYRKLAVDIFQERCHDLRAKWIKKTWPKANAQHYQERGMQAPTLAQILGTRAILPGATGLSADGSMFATDGFTYDEIIADPRWTLDPTVQTPMDKSKLFDNQMKLWAAVGAHGTMDPWTFTEGAIELLEVRRPGMMAPRPNVRDAHEEHEDILMNVPPTMGRHENYSRHLVKHEEFLREIQMAMKQQGQESQIPPLVKLYLEDMMQGGQALQVLMAHVEETRKMAQGKITQSGQAQGGPPSNQGSIGRDKMTSRQASDSGLPPGVQKPIQRQLVGSR
ncbi:MAG: hypothetical protein V3W22_04815 [Thermoplasmata archaeon]